MRQKPKALLLRVGIDRGTGGALAPIFADGTFEYIPIPEERPTRAGRTYATLAAHHGGSLAAYLPSRLAKKQPHFDPDFDAATYGDALPRKRRQLGRLAPHDLLAFYSGLAPLAADDAPRLFLIGYLTVKQIYRLSAADIVRDAAVRRRFGETAHFLRRVPDSELVLVEGYRSKSRRFARARPLGGYDQCLLRDLSPLFGYRGSLQRAVGHWIEGDESLASLSAWLDKGVVSLVKSANRLWRCPLSAFRRRASGRGDLIIADSRPHIGDWVLAWNTRRRKAILILARVNEVAGSGARRHAFASLFWRVDGAVPKAVSVTARAIGLRRPNARTTRDAYAIRRLVRSIGAHYRIGYHSPPGIADSIQGSAGAARRRRSERPERPRATRVR